MLWIILTTAVYTVATCKYSSENLTVSDLSFIFNGEASAMLPDGGQPVFLPGKRLNNSIAGFVYWRLDMEYGATVNAIDPVVAPSGSMYVCHDPEND